MARPLPTSSRCLLLLLVGLLSIDHGRVTGQPSLRELFRLRTIQADILMDTFRYIEDKLTENNERLDEKLRGIDSRIRDAEGLFGIDSPTEEQTDNANQPVFPEIPEVVPDENEGSYPDGHVKQHASTPAPPPIGQIARSCDEIYRIGYRNDNDYVIDPDGPSPGSMPEFMVRCELSRGEGVTIVGHTNDAEAIFVTGYEQPGSFQAQLRYNNANFDQLRVLTEVSAHCEQYIKLVCEGAVLFRARLKDSERDYGWWIARDGTRMMSWGGVESSTDSGQCSCDLDGTCVNSNFKCNCDSNNKFRTEDSGYLTDKTYLPVRMIYLGDTGGTREKSWLTLGELRCKGYVE